MTSSDTADLSFDSLIRGYVEANPRFVRRDWLATEVDGQLAEAGKQFVLLTAEPGAGKSVFMAQLAHDHPEWLRYFIRRDQREVLADVSARSLLLRVGYQLAARHPELFSKNQLSLSVKQRLGEVAEQGEAVGVEVERLIASPFYRKVLEIEQQVQVNRGKVVGLRAKELYVEERLLPADDLLHMALIHPARALLRTSPKQQLVILIDALDEIRYHPTTDNILAWLTHCPELPDNIRFVLTSRPPDETLRLFCDKQASRLGELTIAEEDPHVKDDIAQFVTRLIGEAALADALDASPGGAAAFATQASAKAHGNLGYLDALARGLDQALAETRAEEEPTRLRGRSTLNALLSLTELPADLGGLYAFFLHQIKEGVADQQIVGKDSSGKTFSTDVWPAVYEPILGVLAVAAEPVEAELIAKLGDIAVDLKWVRPALNRLRQFLDAVDNRYRFFHATVAEFLTADKTRDNRAIADLYQDSKQRHQQIADHYWTQRADWSNCDAYGLDALATHLLKCGDAQRLYALVSQTWMIARVRANAGSYRGFLADLDMVRQEIRRLSTAVDCPAVLLSWAVRVALVRTSINSVATAYPPSLVARAVACDLWPPERALIAARQVPDKRNQAQMYALVLATGKLSDGLRKEALDEGLSAALAVHADYESGRAVAELAPFIDDEPQLQRAWAAASKIRSKWQEVRAVVKAALAVRFSGKARNGALEDALKDTLDADDGDPRDGLSVLAPHLTGRLLMHALRDKNRLPEVLPALVPHLPDDLLPRLVELAGAIEEEEDRVRALGALAPRMRRDLRLSVSTAVLEDLTKVESSYTRDEMITALAPWIDESLLGRMMDFVLSVKDRDSRASGVRALAPRLNEEAAEEALLAVEKKIFKADRTRVLAALCPQLGGSSRARVLATVLHKATGADKVWIIEALAPLLDAERANELCLQALGESGPVRIRMLTALLPRLDGERAKKALRELSNLDGEEISELVNALPEEIRQELIEPLFRQTVDLRPLGRPTEAWAALAPYLSEDLLELGLRAALHIGDTDQIVSLRKKIAAMLTPSGAPPSRRARKRSHAGAASSVWMSKDVRRALTTALSVTDLESRAAALKGVFDQFRGSELRDAVLEVLDYMLNAYTSDWYARDEQLASLAPFLDGELQEKALEVATEFLRQRHGKALVVLAGMLTDSQVARVFAVATEEPHPAGDLITSHILLVREVHSAQASLIARLAPKLTRTQLTQAISATAEFHVEAKVIALAGLAPYLGESQRTRAIEEAIGAAAGAFPDSEKEIFALLGPLIGPAHRAQALAAAESCWSAIARARALSALHPYVADDASVVFRIRRAVIEYLLDSFDASDRGHLLSEIEAEVIPLPIFDGDSLRAIDNDLLELSEHWTWL